jgi:hypothetical protein
VAGKVAAAGAPSANHEDGAVYVYVRDGRTWRREEIKDPNSGAVQNFGFAVGVSGTTMIAGNFLNSGIGAVYLYSLTGRTWRLSATLHNPHPNADNDYGYGVAIDGNTAVVGDPDGDNGRGAGYVYVRSGGHWRLQGTLTDPKAFSGPPGQELGWEVAISGSTIAMSGIYESGALFVRRGTKWFLQASLGRVPEKNIFYVSDIALSGNTAVIGRPEWDGTRGAAYIFTRTGSVWKQTARLIAPHPTRLNQFGNGVTVSGSRMVIGAPNKGVKRCGTAYEYVETHGTWREREQIANPGCSAHDYFGDPVALSGTTAVIGAPGKGNNAGAVYVLTVP